MGYNRARRSARADEVGCHANFFQSDSLAPKKAMCLTGEFGYQVSDFHYDWASQMIAVLVGSSDKSALTHALTRVQPLIRFSESQQQTVQRSIAHWPGGRLAIPGFLHPRG